MMQLSRYWGAFLLLLAVGMVVAGDSSPYVQAIEQMLKSMEEIGASLKTIDTEESAGAAKPALRKAAVSWIEARDKAAKLQAPEKAEKERLTRLYKPKLEEALKKVFRELPRVEAIPGGKEALKEISGVLKKDGK